MPVAQPALNTVTAQQSSTTKMKQKKLPARSAGGERKTWFKRGGRGGAKFRIQNSECFILEGHLTHYKQKPKGEKERK